MPRLQIDPREAPTAPDGAVGEAEAWDGCDGAVIWQWACGACDKGLLLAPARFCGKCAGSGYLNVWVSAHVVA